MKLQVLFGVYACVLPFHLQAEEERRERPIRPFTEKRGEDSQNNGERNGKMRPHHEGEGEMFGMLDKNNDKVITSEEFFAGPRMANMPQEQRDKLFARMDLDGDGKVTPEEIRKMRQESHEKHMREVRELDTDKSGGLSFEEMSLGKFFSQLPEEKRRQIFERMDTNGDGQITPEDKPQGPRPQPENREREERGERSKVRDADGEAPSKIK
jgi:Ca2+-binding EF-hand superfamily protein